MAFIDDMIALMDSTQKGSLVLQLLGDTYPFVDTGPLANAALYSAGTGLSADTTLKKEGVSSIKFAAAQNEYSFARSSNFRVNMGEAYTFRAWVYFSASAASTYLYGLARWGWDGSAFTGAGSGIRHNKSVSSGQLQISFDPARTVTATGVASGTWHHIQVSRDASNKVYHFLNGVLLESAYQAAGADNTAYAEYGFSLGRNMNSSANSSITGNYDVVEFIKGKCLNTSNFTPDAIPYGST